MTTQPQEPIEGNVMTQELVEAVKAHAKEHYEDGGWDVVVECWEDADIAELLERDKVATTEQAVAAFLPVVDVWADRQADARNSAF